MPYRIKLNSGVVIEADTAFDVQQLLSTMGVSKNGAHAAADESRALRVGDGDEKSQRYQAFLASIRPDQRRFIDLLSTAKDYVSHTLVMETLSWDRNKLNGILTGLSKQSKDNRLKLIGDVIQKKASRPDPTQPRVHAYRISQRLRDVILTAA